MIQWILTKGAPKSVHPRIFILESLFGVAIAMHGSVGVKEDGALAVEFSLDLIRVHLGQLQESCRR